jgi:hypothetical protein
MSSGSVLSLPLKGMIMPRLYKATIVIWSEFNPDGIELERLGREADQGEAYCSQWSTELVEDPMSDPAYSDGMTEFFQMEEE